MISSLNARELLNQPYFPWFVIGARSALRPRINHSSLNIFLNSVLPGIFSCCSAEKRLLLFLYGGGEEPSPGSKNHSRLTKFRETITLWLDKHFYRPAENLYQKPTCYTNVYSRLLQSTVLPLASLLGSHQDSKGLLCFHLRPHLSFVIIGFGNNSLGRKQETGRRLSGNSGGQKRVNSPEKSALSFRISQPVS